MSNIITLTLLAIDNAARSAQGDYRATERALARFCTEALVGAAESCRAGMTQAQIAQFLPSESRGIVRDCAVRTLCGWVNCQRLVAWRDAFEATRNAALAEMPQALEMLGGAL
jgi:hypothetical protein